MSDLSPHRPAIVLPKGERVSILVHGLLIFGGVGAMALGATSKTASLGGAVLSQAVSVPYLLAAFLLIVSIPSLALKVSRNPAVFRGLFALLIFMGSWSIAGTYLPPAPALLVAAAITLLHAFWKTAMAANASLAIGTAGIAAGIAKVFSPDALLFLLTALSFYDILAVYRTGHMVRMFRELRSLGAVLAFLLTPLRFSDLTTPAASRPERPGMLLGVGDVFMPVALACAALRQGFLPAVAAVSGAAAGFAATYLLYLAQPKRAPMPALPPIALGAIIAYAVSLLIQHP